MKYRVIEKDGVRKLGIEKDGAYFFFDEDQLIDLRNIVRRCSLGGYTGDYPEVFLCDAMPNWVECGTEDLATDEDYE